MNVDYFMMNVDYPSNTTAVQTTTTGEWNNNSQITLPNAYPSAPGHTCTLCGQWVSSYGTHQCYPSYYPYPYHTPISIPTVWIQTTPLAVKDPEVAEFREEINDLRTQVAELRGMLETLLKLGHNSHEEVCGDPEGECTGVDSGGVPGACLKAPAPPGNWSWPPKS